MTSCPISCNSPKKVIYYDNYLANNQDDGMKERLFLEQVRTLPVFTTKQVSAILGNNSYAKVYLYRLVERGLVKRLKSGLYTVHDDPVIYATHIYYPSYISLWYAFQHYGTTTQLPTTIEVMAAKKDIVQDVEFIRTRYPWGYHSIRYGDFNVFIADLEKAVIDAIITGRVPVDELKSALRQCNFKKLEEYSLRLNMSTMKKIGYVVETLSGYFSERLYKVLTVDRNYVHFYAAEGKNKWRVISD